MECARNKVYHSTMGLLRVNNSSNTLSEIVVIINYHSDMNQLHNFLFFSILDLKTRSFNVSCTISKMTGIDNVDTCFVVLTDSSRSSRGVPGKLNHNKIRDIFWQQRQQHKPQLW